MRKIKRPTTGKPAPSQNINEEENLFELQDIGAGDQGVAPDRGAQTAARVDLDDDVIDRDEDDDIGP